MIMMTSACVPRKQGLHQESVLPSSSATEGNIMTSARRLGRAADGRQPQASKPFCFDFTEELIGPRDPLKLAPVPFPLPVRHVEVATAPSAPTLEASSPRFLNVPPRAPFPHTRTTMRSCGMNHGVLTALCIAMLVGTACQAGELGGNPPQVIHPPWRGAIQGKPIQLRTSRRLGRALSEK